MCALVRSRGELETHNPPIHTHTAFSTWRIMLTCNRRVDGNRKNWPSFRVRCVCVFATLPDGHRQWHKRTIYTSFPPIARMKAHSKGPSGEFDVLVVASVSGRTCVCVCVFCVGKKHGHRLLRSLRICQPSVSSCKHTLLPSRWLVHLMKREEAGDVRVRSESVRNGTKIHLEAN